MPKNRIELQWFVHRTDPDRALVIFRAGRGSYDFVTLARVAGEWECNPACEGFLLDEWPDYICIGHAPRGAMDGIERYNDKMAPIAIAAFNALDMKDPAVRARFKRLEAQTRAVVSAA